MMRNLPPLHGVPELDLSPPSAADAARRGNRRRLRVFLLVFVLVLLPGMAWNLLRPPEYRAAVRMQITPGVTDVAPAPAAGVPAPPPPDLSAAFLTQVQILTSRPLLEQVSRTLGAAGYPLTGAGSDPVAGLQRMISATPVSGTEVVEVAAIGAPPELPALALNALVDAYRARMLTAHDAADDTQLAQARDEVMRLERTVAERRGALDEFRGRHGVVSSERDENVALAGVKGLASALNTAVERAANADAQVRALREGIAGGRGSVRSRDDPTLAAMEKRASELREDLRDMERVYTPDFMAMDPQARAQRARLEELEKQIVNQRGSSQEAALAAAQEEAASAHAAVERLRAQIAAQRQDAQSFAGRFSEAKALEDDLAQLEAAHRTALDRLARLEASEAGRDPVLNLVEGASVPRSAFRPDYVRDGGIVAAVAFIAGLLAMGFVELFNRSAPAATPTTTVVMPQPWLTAGALPLAAPAGPPAMLPGEAPAGLLAAPALPPRELEQHEVAALLAACDGATRLACAALLLGVDAEELTALRGGDLDVQAGALRIGGAAPRRVAVPGWLHPSAGEADAPLVANTAGAPLAAAELRAQVLCAAVDAGLEAAAGVTPEVLRHTCIAWLVRQGVRFSELAARVGRVDAEALAAYADLAAQAPRQAGAVEPVMPALRAAPST